MNRFAFWDHIIFPLRFGRLWSLFCSLLQWLSPWWQALAVPWVILRLWYTITCKQSLISEEQSADLWSATITSVIWDLEATRAFNHASKFELNPIGLFFSLDIVNPFLAKLNCTLKHKTFGSPAPLSASEFLSWLSHQGEAALRIPAKTSGS